jgi:hypothetical protein
VERRTLRSEFITRIWSAGAEGLETGSWLRSMPMSRSRARMNASSSASVGGTVEAMAESLPIALCYGFRPVVGTSLDGEAEKAAARFEKTARSTSFAGNGKRTFTFGGVDAAEAVLVQPDSRIVVAGQRMVSDGFALARLLA